MYQDWVQVIDVSGLGTDSRCIRLYEGYNVSRVKYKV